VLPPGEGSDRPVIVTAADQSSPAATFNYDPPAITSVSPANGPTAGGILITVTGTNFGTGGSVTIGGFPAASVWSTQSQIQCVLPAGQGSNLPVVVSVEGLPSTVAGSFNYNPPVITSVSPACGPTAGGATLTVTGTNFGTSGMVTIGGISASNLPGQWSDGQIQCLTPGGVGEALPVVVVTAGQASGAGVFSYVQPSMTTSNAPSGMTLMWPSDATDYVLETSGEVSGAPWTLVTLAFTTNAGFFNMVMPLTCTNAFYRLRRP
jgi:hypothetical protein